ncbi:hypothetical protein N6L27_22665 [Leisingera sp. SS27]|uniref:hypothetical protein n=1 Tax=Leisingera sp. SS27 TaxID=2979462 RepID=UPI00232DC7F4|nr:hypothetical protein [Leisingera sp. SS27]MDC0660819.1 hypothetical protein [Leisingera sp. SS27]
MGQVVRSLRMWDPETEKHIVLEANESQLRLLEADIRANKDAIAALYEWDSLCRSSLANGETSSPELPPSMSIFWAILKQHDPRWPGGMGSRLLNEMTARICGERS